MMRPDIALPLPLPRTPHRAQKFFSDPAGWNAGASQSAALPARADTILIVFQDFAAGGTERIMVRLANIWAAQRRVIIVCGSRRGPAATALSDRVEVVQATPEIPRSIFSRWRLGRQLTRIVAKLEPDVIVGPGNHVLPVFMAMRRLRVPVVCKLSNPLSRRTPAGFGGLIQRAVHATIFRSVSKVVAMSPALRAEAIQLVDPDKVEVIAEPILPQYDGPTPRTAQGDSLRLLFAGRLVAQKNAALAIRAFARLPVSACLTIVGSGPERQRLEELAVSLGIAERVVFTGQVPSIDPYLRSADMLILPSRYEGYPAVLIEALAAGIPVVTTACSPSLNEILLHPSFGRVTDPDPDALADAVMTLHSSGALAREPLLELIERHREDVSAHQWLACLDDVVRSA